MGEGQHGREGRRCGVRESDLYAPVREWLSKQYPDHKIHVEKFDADVIAIKEQHVVVVELKACMTEEKPAMDHELAGLPACAALREQRERRSFSEAQC